MGAAPATSRRAAAPEDLHQMKECYVLPIALAVRGLHLMLAKEKNRVNVAVVVDPAYGERLEELSANVPVWVVATPINEEAYRRIWERRLVVDHRVRGAITSFRISDAENRRANLLKVIPEIEEHYGSWKVGPPVRNDPDDRYPHLVNDFGLDVVGLDLTNDLKDSLKGFGFLSFASTRAGFHAWIVRGRVAE